MFISTFLQSRAKKAIKVENVVDFFLCGLAISSSKGEEVEKKENRSNLQSFNFGLLLCYFHAFAGGWSELSPF